MDRRLLKTAGIIASVAFVLASCSDIAKMQVPETVSVKTNATYSANFGSYSQSLSDYISADTITEQINNSSFSVYDYNPGSSASIQEFLIKYPVLNKTIDVGSSISGIDLTSAGNSASINQSFVIPDLSRTFTQNITFPDLNSRINSKTAIDAAEISVIDPGSEQTVGSSAVPDIILNISSPQFSTLTYRTGSLSVTIAPTGSTTLTNLTLTAVLKNSSTNVIISTSGAADVHSGGTLTIPLAGKTLVPSMKISFSGTIDGSSVGSSIGYAVTPAISDAELSEVTGLTLSAGDLGPSGEESIGTQVDLSGTAPLTSAEIGTGSLSVQCPLPPGWSGVTATASGLALSGALTSSGFTDNGGSAYLLNQSLPLAGLTFTPGMLTVNGTITLALNNATIIFPDGGISLTTTASCAISKLAKATIDTSGYTLSETYSSDVPEDLSSFVNSITYSKAGVKVGAYTNTLPAGNDITLTLTSSFLSITGTDAEGTVSAATTNGTLELAKTTPDDPYTTITVSGASSIDMTVAVALPGTSGSTATFSDLATNTTYTLAASDFTAELEWTSININPTALEISTTDGVDTGIDFNSIMGSLPDAVQTAIDSIQLDTLPVYLSVEMPDFSASSNSSLKNLSLKGSVYLQYTDTASGSSVPVPVPILGTETTTAPLTQKAVSLTTENSVVTTDLATEGLPSGDLAEAFNARPDSIKLFYNIIPNSTDGITISHSDYDSITTNGVNIAATVYIVFPLKATIENSMTLDIMSLAGKSSGDDLLGRTEALNTSDYQKYLDAIKSITLGVTVGNTMGLSDANIKITDTDGIFGTDGMTLYMSGSSTASLTGAQISSILQTYPYLPTVILSVPAETEIAIPRNADISVGLSAKVTTDGTIQLYGGNN
jgi:hypothetical protein